MHIQNDGSCYATATHLQTAASWVTNKILNNRRTHPALRQASAPPITLLALSGQLCVCVSNHLWDSVCAHACACGGVMVISPSSTCPTRHDFSDATTQSSGHWETKSRNFYPPKSSSVTLSLVQLWCVFEGINLLNKYIFLTKKISCTEV